jgi:hypothetical protein
LFFFGEEKRGTFLEEKEGALHEGLSKTIEILRRISWFLGSCMESISMES